MLDAVCLCGIVAECARKKHTQRVHQTAAGEVCTGLEACCDTLSALLTLARSCSDAYYNSATPLLSDAEYDALALTLTDEMPVGAPPPRDAVVGLHSAPMLSLQSVRSVAQLDDV